MTDPTSRNDDERHPMATAESMLRAGYDRNCSRQVGCSAAVAALERDSRAALPRRRTVSVMEGTPESKARESWSYSGEVWTNGDGRTVVMLPPFVRVHSAGFDYELRPVDSPGSATVTDEIVNGRFTIATDEPHVKVAWRVTAFKEERS